VGKAAFRCAVGTARATFGVEGKARLRVDGGVSVTARCSLCLGGAFVKLSGEGGNRVEVSRWEVRCEKVGYKSLQRV
jgi:hypothetical protein